MSVISSAARNLFSASDSPTSDLLIFRSLQSPNSPLAFLFSPAQYIKVPTNKKGFAPIVAILILLFLIVGIGIALVNLKTSKQISSRASSADYGILVPDFTHAGAWAESFLNSLPSSGTYQTHSTYVIANTMYQSFWRSSQGFSRKVPIVNNSPDWKNATSWSAPSAVSSLPGTGDMQVADNYVIGQTLFQAFWRGNSGYTRKVPIVNNLPDWNKATPWSSPLSLSSLPGDGTLLAHDNYVVDNTLYQTIWRKDEITKGNNKGFTRKVPIIAGIPDFTKATSWATPIASFLPGSGGVIATSGFVIGNNLYQSVWRGDKSYLRTVPLTKSSCESILDKNFCGTNQCTWLTCSGITQVGCYPNDTRKIAEMCDSVPTERPTSPTPPAPPEPTEPPTGTASCVSFESIQINGCNLAKWNSKPKAPECVFGSNTALRTKINLNPPNSNVNLMRFAELVPAETNCANLPDDKFGPWERFNITKDIQLTPDNGNQKVCVQFKQEYNPSSAYTSSKCGAMATVVACDSFFSAYITKPGTNLSCDYLNWTSTPRGTACVTNSTTVQLGVIETTGGYINQFRYAHLDNASISCKDATNLPWTSWQPYAPAQVGGAQTLPIDINSRVSGQASSVVKECVQFRRVENNATIAESPVCGAAIQYTR